MKLLIVSHTPHYKAGQTYVGWGPTVREIDSLTDIFDQIVHIAPLHPEPPPMSALAYQSARIQLRPVSPAGGHRALNKVAILARAPEYVRSILEELRTADVVHVRCPANISLIAIVLLALVRFPRNRWVKYAGNWRPNSGEPHSYALQRWWLNRGLHRGVVTVNGHWPDQPPHVRSFRNPSLTEQELSEAEQTASGKEMAAPVRLIYVGGLNRTKGVDQALNILARLNKRRILSTLDLVGDGPERHELESLAATAGVSHLVKFHGWLPRPTLGTVYSRAHIIVLPSRSEGWPKVLSEAMAYGVVPVSSNVSCVGDYLRSFGAGKTFEPDDVEGFTEAIANYSAQPGAWKEESQKSMQAAHSFTYANYLNSVQNLFDLN